MTQRAIDGPYIYFVTTNTTQWSRIFDIPARAALLGQVIQRAGKEFGFAVYAYAILPDHLHLLVMKQGPFTLSRLVKHIKGRFSRILWLGRVWKPRFFFRIVETQSYFTNVVTYIQYNYQKTALDERYGKTPYVFINWIAIKELFSNTPRT